MVQLLLRRGTLPLLLAGGLSLLPASAFAAPKTKTPPSPPEFWQMSLDGGRSLTWQRDFDSQAQVENNRGLWKKLVDAVAGLPANHSLIRPYSLVTDSRGRIIVTDPGASGIHIFDFAAHKYKYIQRRDRQKGAMLAPQCVAVDADDNIYVTDSESGVIFVFEPSGKFLRTIGSLRGGEGYFKRPTGIAVDSPAQRIYISDTLRDQVFVLDMDGHILQTIGSSGRAPGEFNRPTELRLEGSELLVVDSMNFRVQVFDRSGQFEFAIGQIGDHPGAMFRPKAVGMDSEGDVYVVDAMYGVVQVFNRQSQLLYYFGGQGTHAGEFQLPTGLFIDGNDRVFVVDSYNHRIQEFQYAGLKKLAMGEAK